MIDVTPAGLFLPASRFVYRKAAKQHSSGDQKTGLLRIPCAKTLLPRRGDNVNELLDCILEICTVLYRQHIIKHPALFDQINHAESPYLLIYLIFVQYLNRPLQNPSQFNTILCPPTQLAT